MCEASAYQGDKYMDMVWDRQRELDVSVRAGLLMKRGIQEGNLDRGRETFNKSTGKIERWVQRVEHCASLARLPFVHKNCEVRRAGCLPTPWSAWIVSTDAVVVLSMN